MNTRIFNRALCLGIAAALALPVAGNAFAQQTLGVVEVGAHEGNAIAMLSEATGISERQIQMVLGDRTYYAGYVASYDFVDQRLRRSIGPEMYRHLKQQGELTALDVQNLTAMVNARRSNGTLASR
jgi:hypothetical protein